MMSGAILHQTNSLHTSQETSPGHAGPTNPDTGNTSEFHRTPKNADIEPERSSITTPRASSENVVHVFSKLPIVFDFADYASAQAKLSGDNEILLDLVQRVRQDVAEVSQLYATRAVTGYLESLPDKKLWVDNALLDIQRALNDIGTHIENVKISGDDGSLTALRRKFDLVLSHDEELSNKQRFLTTCHQSLMETLRVLYAVENSITGKIPYDETFGGPHSSQRLRLSLKNTSLPSILISGVEEDHIDMPATNSPVELPGSTPEDLPDPDSWDLYAAPTRPRSLSASAVSTTSSIVELPTFTITSQVKPVEIYIAYNPRLSTQQVKAQTSDDAIEEDSMKDTGKIVVLPDSPPSSDAKAIPSTVNESASVPQVATSHVDREAVEPPIISPLSADSPRRDASNAEEGASGNPIRRNIMMGWPARSSSKVPPKIPPPRKTFNKIKPLPLYTRSRSSDAVSRSRAVSDQLRGLEDKARSSFDSKPRPMPTVQEKPLDPYNTAASIRVSPVSPISVTTRSRPKEFGMRKPPSKSHSLPIGIELPDVSSTGSLMEELSHWILPPGARTSYHSMDTSGSLGTSTPATSADGSPINNGSRDVKETEVLLASPTAITSSEALKSPASAYRLFPSTPTIPGAPARPPPPLPKDLLPRIEKPKIVVSENSTPIPSRPMSPEESRPTLPPRPKAETTEPSAKNNVRDPTPSEEVPPSLPPRPAPTPSEETPVLPPRPVPRSLSPSGPSILDPPLPSPQGPLPALPFRRPSPQASSSSLSADDGSGPYKNGSRPRQSRRNTSRTRHTHNAEESPSQQAAEKALPIPQELRALSEQLKHDSPTSDYVPNYDTGSTPPKPRTKAEVTMEFHPGTLVMEFPSLPAEPEAPVEKSPPTPHTHPETTHAPARPRCESRVTAQTKRRQAHARRMQMASADD